jgi:glucokinase
LKNIFTSKIKLVIPIVYSDKLQTIKNKLVLAGDLGATKMNVALYAVNGGGMNVIASQQYYCDEHKSMIEIMELFMEGLHKKPESICIGVAGAVIDNKADLLNLGWEVNGNEVKTVTRVKNVSLINDLEANAYGLACLRDDDMIVINEGEVHPGNAAIIAPGTGLGEAGLFWDGKFYHPFATEGGHADFAPRTELDFELTKYFLRTEGIPSWDRIISGQGIHIIYNFLRDEKKFQEPDWLKEEFTEEDIAAAISEAALNNKAAICVETMKLFARYLARECSNLVLKMKAVGGLFIGGGIPPKIEPLIQTKTFIDNYLDCDRQQDLVGIVPIKLIKTDKAPLMGAAFYAACAPAF